jgi:hypothetical protein
MKTGKHFVVIKKLDTKNVNGNLVSNDFDISEISETLGDVSVDTDAPHVKYENDNVYNNCL